MRRALCRRLCSALHRFEWTRAEFEAWARGVAAEHGYAVSFHGVGKVTCAHPEVQQASEAAGYATQVAVFEQAPHA